VIFNSVYTACTAIFFASLLFMPSQPELSRLGTNMFFILDIIVNSNSNSVGWLI